MNYLTAYKILLLLFFFVRWRWRFVYNLYFKSASGRIKSPEWETDKNENVYYDKKKKEGKLGIIFSSFSISDTY